MHGDSMSASNAYLVTALVSAYNAATFLRPCLDDLLTQTLYKKKLLEIIVIDSGSLENEGVIVAEYQKSFQHIRYLRTERETVYGAWNRGIGIAQGTYITNANTDDAHRYDALELLAAALNKYPDADIAYAHCAFTNRPNDTFPSSNSYLDCLFPPFNSALGMFYCLLGPHTVWRRTLFSKIGAFDSSFAGAGDYDFQMRFIQAGLQAVLVPEILSLFYQNPSGLSLSSNRTIIESREIEAKYRVLIPIDRLYSVDPTNAQSVADAWVEQGNLALTWECAWEKNPPKDIAYAFQCYRKALEVQPGHYPAVRNLIMCLAVQGKWQACDYFVARYPQYIDLAEACARQNILTLISGNATPRICSHLVFTDSLTTASLQEQPINPLSLTEHRNNLGRAFSHIQKAINAINARELDIAFDELENSCSYVEGDAELQLAIGILMLGLGKPYDAQELLLRAYTKNPETEGLRTCLNYIGDRAKGTATNSIPQSLLDMALHIFGDLEYRAVELPTAIAPQLLAGAKAAHNNNLDEALAQYGKALEQVATSNHFARPLQDKFSFIHSIITSSEPEALSPVSISTFSNAVLSDVSRLCRQEDFETYEYAELCRELDIPQDHYERKNWEYYFVAQALREENLLKDGKMGLGFGVGKEKMISYLARHGCAILATDLEPDSTGATAWIDSNQHSDSVRDLFLPGICDYETFASKVQFAYVNMNRIPEELQREEFDFTWSCCAFEHVGSIELGKQFILNQMKCLKPGGIAVHTTEFNLSSDVLTVETGPTVIFRKCDIEEIAESLRKDGHEILLNYDVGGGELDRYVDIPPFLSAPDKRHLRLLLGKFITTSIGLFIRKKV